LNFITKLKNFDEVSRRNIPTQFVQFDRVDSKKKRLMYENDVDEDNNRSEWKTISSLKPLAICLSDN
jgi:hypothetical protein